MLGARMTLITVIGLVAAVIWTVGLLIAVALCVSARSGDRSRPAPPLRFERSA